MDGGLASGLPSSLFICCHLIANSMPSVDLCCKYPVFPPSPSICGYISRILSISFSLFFLACGVFELSDKCSGLNNGSCRSSVSSEFICQSHRRIKALHFLRLPQHRPRAELSLHLCTAVQQRVSHHDQIHQSNHPKLHKATFYTNPKIT